MELRKCIPAEMNPPLNVTLISDVEGLAKVSSFLSSVKEFGLDIETNVTKTFFDRRIRTIQVGNRTEQYVIDLLALAGSSEALINGMGNYAPAPWAKPLVDCLRPFLESDQVIKVGHGLDFEYETFKFNLGLRIFGLHDTMLTEKVICAGAIKFFTRGYWALDDLVGRYCGLEISKEFQKSFDLHSPLSQDQIEYGALDVRFPIAIKGAQTIKVVGSQLERTVQIENDALPAFVDMHLNGQLIDEGKWNAMLDKTRALHQKNLAAMDEQFIPIVGVCQPPFSLEYTQRLESEWRNCTNREDRAIARKEYQEAASANTKHRKLALKFEGNANLQYGSPKQLLTALQAAGYKIKDTNDNTLELLEGDPIIHALREYRTTEKTLSSYSSYLEKYVDKNSGRVHSRLDQLGADTGRTSASSPNTQNLDRDPGWRASFVARPRHKIITIDYSGCELRILAEASGEPVWIDAFNKGWDVHSVGAEIMFAQRWKDGTEPGCAYAASHEKCKCAAHKVFRQQIKEINFGIANGMEAGKLSRKLQIKKTEAQELLRLYRKAFPTVTTWLEGEGKKGQLELSSRTMAGRRRLYEKPTWERAKEIAIDRAKKDGKPFDPSTINRVYQGLYGSVAREVRSSQIQGTNADFLKLAVGCGYDRNGVGFMWHKLESVYGARLLNEVHDEVVIECREDNAQEVYDYAADCMTRAGGEFLKLIVAETEGCIKDHWSK